MAGYADNSSGYGLITGMANGFREGLIGYQTVQNQKHQQQMQELLSGVTKDDDGNLQLTPQAQQARDFTAQKQSDEMGHYKSAHDVNSPYSESARKTYGLLASKLGYGDEHTFDNQSAADIEEQNKGLLTPAASAYVGEKKANATTTAAGTRADTAEDIAEQRRNDKAAADAARADAADERANSKKDDAYKAMRKDMESFRGNSAAQQAAVKVQNADTALAIVKNKDPNTLTTQDLRLFADEMGKIATGGVPGEHGTTSLMPNNLQTKWAEIQNFLSSNPTDAEAGKYIQHNIKYMEDMKDVAKSTLSQYRANIARGYKHKVKEEDYNEAASDYGYDANRPSVLPAAGGQVGQGTPMPPQSPGLVGKSAPQGSPTPVPQGFVTVIGPNGQRMAVSPQDLPHALATPGWQVAK